LLFTLGVALFTQFFFELIPVLKHAGVRAGIPEVVAPRAEPVNAIPHGNLLLPCSPLRLVLLIVQG